MEPTVVIAEGYQIFLEGLRSLLAPHFEIVGEAADGEALIAIAQEKKPDIIVSDLSLPKVSSLQALRDLTKKGIASKFIILSMHTEPEFAAEAIEMGAAGYLLKNATGSELLTAINHALQGNTYIPPQLAREVLAGARKPRRISDLSDRQQKILPLLAQGISANEIGNRLEISPRTVEYHRYQIMEKLHLTSTADLIQFAIRRKLVESQ